jgi:hypothetical protein
MPFGFIVITFSFILSFLRESFYTLSRVDIFGIVKFMCRIFRDICQLLSSKFTHSFFVFVGTFFMSTWSFPRSLTWSCD